MTEHTMLSALPLLAFLALWILLVNADTRRPWRLGFLRAALLCGAWVVVSTEILSMIRGITQVGLAMAWLLPLGVVVGILIVRFRKKGLIWRPDLSWLKQWHHAFLAALVLLVCLITALVAVLAPPNESETLHYRMARVAHWAQNKSVAHYPTAIEIQNSFSPFAEYGFLHSFLLSNTDLLAPLVSWFAIFGCILGVSLIAALLGASTSGQLLASLFTATLPLAIVQASSTMNEGIVAFCMVCIAVEFLLLWRNKEPPFYSATFLSLGAGLGLVTKPLIAPYLLPYVLAVAIILFRKTKWLHFVRLACLALAICVVLNAGYLWRNHRTYGTFLDAPLTRVHRNEMRDWKGLLSNLLRNAAVQASTPWQGLNYQITRLVVGIHFKLGMDINDPLTTAHGEFWVRPISTSDTTSQSAFHAWIVLFTFLLTTLQGKRLGWRVWCYQLLVLGGYIAFCYLFKWQIFGTRYLLPFFVLYAPLVGIVLTTRWPILTNILGVGLFLAAWPWLFSLQLRPIIAQAGRTYPTILLVGSREEVYFASAKGLYPSYKRIAAQIQTSRCQEVGLYLSGTTPEYLWWVVLDAPRNDIRIEWMMAGESAKYRDSSFVPCAVISDDAGEQETLLGLPLIYSQGNLHLYLGEAK